MRLYLLLDASSNISTSRSASTLSARVRDYFTATRYINHPLTYLLACLAYTLFKDQDKVAIVSSYLDGSV